MSIVIPVIVDGKVVIIGFVVISGLIVLSVIGLAKKTEQSEYTIFLSCVCVSSNIYFKINIKKTNIYVF